MNDFGFWYFDIFNLIQPYNWNSRLSSTIAWNWLANLFSWSIFNYLEWSWTRTCNVPGYWQSHNVNLISLWRIVLRTNVMKVNSFQYQILIYLNESFALSLALSALFIRLVYVGWMNRWLYPFNSIERRERGKCACQTIILTCVDQIQELANFNSIQAYAATCGESSERGKVFEKENECHQ